MSGAVVSGAVVVAAEEVLPAVSVAVAFKLWPLVSAGSRVTVKVPSAATFVLPSILPSASLMVTVEPASALPVTVSPSALTATSVGAAGAVVSGAEVVVAAEVFPAVSVAVALKVSPLVCAVVRVTLKVPSLPAVALPRILPSASLMVTVEPASALPVTVAPSSLTATPVGAAGAVVSGAIVVASAEMFFAASSAVTLNF